MCFLFTGVVGTHLLYTVKPPYNDMVWTGYQYRYREVIVIAVANSAIRPVGEHRYTVVVRWQRVDAQEHLIGLIEVVGGNHEIWY